MGWITWRNAAAAVTTVFALAAATACSAGDAIPVADDPSTVTISAGPDDPVLVLGSYNIAENIDEFVRGPDVVIYGDGSVYRDTVHLDGGAATRFQRGDVSEQRLVDIVAAGQQLPAVAETPGCGEDEAEETLVIEDRSWADCGLSDASGFQAFIDALHDEVNSLDMTEWVPPAIVEHLPLGGPCAVVESSGLPVSQTAAVYPHAVDRFPLGTFDCPWATP